MLKKEILDTLKQTGLILSFLLITPLIYGVNQLRLEENMSFFVYSFSGLAFLLQLLSFFLAYKMFDSDDQEAAAEYLKSLPISRWKLLAVKILPRFILILLLVFASHKYLEAFWPRVGISFSWFSFGIEGIFQSALITLTILVNGFVLGISERKNPFILLFLLMPVLFLYMNMSPYGYGSILSSELTWLFYFNIIEPNGFEFGVFRLAIFIAYIVGTALPAILPTLLLIPVYKSWDCSSAKIRSNKIMKRMAIPLGFVITLYVVAELKLF